MSNNTNKTINNFLQNAKARVVIAVILVIAGVAVVIGLWRHHVTRLAFNGEASVVSTPAIGSVPGAGNPSNAYVAAQNTENAVQAKQARHDATSFVPTITRQGFVGSPDSFALGNDSDAAPKHACAIKKTAHQYRPDPASCTQANLQLARQSGVTAEELLCQACSCPALKLAGYTVGELKRAGYSAADLKTCGYGVTDLQAAGFSAAELKAAGFTAAELKAAGFTPAELKQAGYSAADLKAAGFTAGDLKNAGFTAAELTQAGFSPAEIAAAGFNDKAALAKTCSVAALEKARLAGVSAMALKAKGCTTAAALRAAGFTAAELKQAGFTAADLKAAGYSAKALKAAGFTAAELKAAGFTPAELKQAGYSAADLKAAGFTAGDLKNAGFTAAQLKAAGFQAADLRKAGFTAADLKAAGFTPTELLDAGYTKGDLLRAGYSPTEAGYAAAVNPSAVTPFNNPATGNNTNNANSATNPANLAAGANQTANQAGAVMPGIDSNSPEARLRLIQQLQQQQLNDQQRRDMMQQMEGQMAMQSQKLMTEWSNSGEQAMRVAIEPTVATVVAGKDSGAKNMPTGPVIKAGNILFAVLDTGINSDEKSPILATIVTGTYKGTKLIGDFERVDKKVLIRFNLMNVPSFDRSFSINAVAIDPDTARTSLAGDVNNHYLLRYGTLFAASFLSGLSQGILQTGASENCWGPFCHTTYSKLSPGQYVALGLGNTGSQYSSVMSQNFNTPPTVKVAGGTGIGILFMTDATLPQPIAQQPLAQQSNTNFNVIN